MVVNKGLECKCIQRPSGSSIHHWNK